MRKIYLFIIAVCFSTSVLASENNRDLKIAQIIEAQGLHQMFQSQLDQSKIAAQELGSDLVKKILRESGASEGDSNPKLEEAVNRNMARFSALFSAQDYVEMWTRFYGQSLSDAELEQILAYYKSSAGKKDVLASQSAMLQFAQEIHVEERKRMDVLTDQLISDLKAITLN
ncbi:DUF2059 domain-containing protein [Deefgea piscis]|uniref:DUF2059 domain-containing protein n=1 Tax=Deefgea piscis TaxID=2739061 RepID=UPI001C7FCA6A|nr:DUF2059 domain-containing protein [Deefgea piscis]QZA80957.1 DUF2059 domain-containing protein [Deefgea piscis]